MVLYQGGWIFIPSGLLRGVVRHQRGPDTIRTAGRSPFGHAAARACLEALASLKGSFKGDLGPYNKGYLRLYWECFGLWDFLWAPSMGP